MSVMTNVLNLKPAEPEPEQESASEVLADAFGPDAVQWQAHNPLPDRARPRQYVAMAVLAFAGGAIAWWQSSWLTLAVVALGLATWEIRERLAQPVSVRVDEHGLTVDGVHYPAARLSSFDLQRMPDDTVELSVTTTTWHARRLQLPLGDQDPEAVRAVLLRSIPQESHPAAWLDRWLRK